MPTFVLLLFVAVGTVMSAPWQDNPDTCGLQGPVSDVSVQSAEEDDAHNYAWPWMARMYYNGLGVCGASLIDPYWVITAANCIGVNKDPRAYMFRVGSVDLKRTTPFTQIRTASETYIHPEYNDKYCKSTNDNDVALLKMSEPFILTEGHEVNSVCLPTKSMTGEFKGPLVTVTGWGKTKNTRVSPHKLKQVHVPMYDVRSCNNTFYPCDIMENMICAGAVTNSKDICEGDSGGPVVGFRGDNKDQYYLIGIESFKPSLGECEAEIQKPSLYTRVSKHEEWIKTIMTTKNKDTTPTTLHPPTHSPNGMHTGTKIVVVLVVIIVVAGLVGLIYYCRNQRYVSYECLTEPLRKPTVYICSSAEDINVSGFIKDLRGQLSDNVAVEYVKLPYNDLDAFQVKKSVFDVIIVCHSIKNRRFAITDVMDSLYDAFLNKAASALGPRRVGVIVHDFPMNKINSEEKFNMEMEAFQTKQPSTFRMASLVLIAGKLEESPTEIERRQWSNINQFITDALSKP